MQKNYSGITLNNIIAKVCSQILLNRLTDWTEKHENISDCQFGYQNIKKAKAQKNASLFYIP